MRSKGFSAALMALIGSVSVSAAAMSAPLGTHAMLSVPASMPVEKVWCRHGYCGGDGGAGVGALIGGIVGGAIAAGAANEAAQQEAQAAAQQHASYCAQRYRSYDPATNTYLSKGRRLTCE